MAVMESLASVRILPLVAAALLVLAPGAAAQANTLDLTLTEFATVAFPGQEVAANYTVAYPCGTQLGDISVVAEVTDGGGVAQADPQTVSPSAPPACTPGQSATHTGSILYTAGVDQLAGEEVTIAVTARGSDATGQGLADDVTKSLTAMVGPFLDVSFNSDVQAFEVVAGDKVPISVNVISTSNTEIMTMASLGGLPPTWPRASIASIQVPSPLAGDDGLGTVDFAVEVPLDALGEVRLTLTMFAHSLTEEYVQTPETTLTYQFGVVENETLKDDNGDSEDSPGLPPTALLVALFGVVFALRRLR